MDDPVVLLSFALFRFGFSAMVESPAALTLLALVALLLRFFLVEESSFGSVDA